MNQDVIYQTGVTEHGEPIIGGIWRLYRQEGFPVDLSLLSIREKGYIPDIMELFAEATVHCELPQVEKQQPELFTNETKKRWMMYLQAAGYPMTGQFEAAKKILMQKRSLAGAGVDTGAPSTES